MAFYGVTGALVTTRLPGCNFAQAKVTAVCTFGSNTGGTLFAKIVDNSKENRVFTQLELQRLIIHIAKVC